MDCDLRLVVEHIKWPVEELFGSEWATANIKKHQAKHFDWWESHGGIACILLRMPDRSRWVIPWKNIKEHWESGIIVKPTFITSIGFKWQYSDDKEPNYDWLTPLLQWHHEVSQ